MVHAVLWVTRERLCAILGAMSEPPYDQRTCFEVFDFLRRLFEIFDPDRIRWLNYECEIMLYLYLCWCFRDSCRQVVKSNWPDPVWTSFGPSPFPCSLFGIDAFCGASAVACCLLRPLAWNSGTVWMTPLFLSIAKRSSCDRFCKFGRWSSSVRSLCSEMWLGEI